ncbi:DUF4397 domain-containing protein [Lujinxingia sediminis]|nr:DUF4397 domain-containing protein [Lujinxingia sediminis]
MPHRLPPLPATLSLHRLLTPIFCGLLVFGGACTCDDDDPDDNPNLDAGDAGDTDDAGDAEDAPPPDVEDDADDTDDADADTGDADDEEVPIPAGQARIQLIHAAADPNAASVDVYLNETLLLDDFEFRTTTPFVDVDGGDDLEIAIAPGDSESVDDALSTFSAVALPADERTIIVVAGVLDPPGFSPNPDGANTTLSLTTFADARERSNEPNFDQLAIFHASSDQPAVALALPDGTELLSQLAYGEFAESYLSVAPGVLAFDLLRASDGARQGSFQTPELTGGEAFVVVATGFADSAQNPDAAFELTLFPSRYGGDRSEGIALDEAARLQLIHNAPDPDAASVDLYLDNELTYPAVAFREATSFRTIVAGEDIELLATAEGDANTEVLTSTLNLGKGQRAVAVIGGVLDPGAFTANPDGEDIALRIFLNSDALEEARSPDTVDLLVFHGVPDAPTVALVTDAGESAQILSETLTYGDFDGYLSVASEDIVAQITPAADTTTPLAGFALPLSLLDGEALTLVASGLLNTTDAARTLALLIVSADGNLTVVAPEE